MRIGDGVAVVTGGAAGLGRATATALAAAGNQVLLVDRNTDQLEAVVGELGPAVSYAICDVTKADEVEAAFRQAEALGPLRILVHCAGGGNALRVLEPDGSPASLEDFSHVVNLNVIGTFDVLRRAATRMAALEPLDGDRGVCVLTASIAGLEGQAAQVAYATAKAGVIGMTLPAARDLSHHAIRVVTIAPGMFDTPMLAGLTPETREGLEASVPHPARLARSEEFASTVTHVIENGIINGTCIRLDGALRLGSVETMWGEQLRRD
jgi:NAD(P)-dependent dehydrogenase (short-subunit alcohol dehydrogenase family)